MHYLFLSLMLMLAACTKPPFEMITHPRYSFVRINEEGYTISGCSTANEKCLPVSELSDLKFQLITDFANITAPSIRKRMIAIPCDECGELTDEEVYQYAFGTEIKQLLGSSDSAGLLRLGFADDFADLQIGDYIILSTACTVADFDYGGQYQVTAIDLAGHRITINTPFNGFILDNCDGGDVYVTALKRGAYLLAATSEELPEDAEFTGENHAWNFAEPFESQLDLDNQQCFRLCIYLVVAEINIPGTLPDLSSVTCLGITNCFTKITNLCYTSKLVYGNNESSFGFYGSPFEVSIRLYFFLKNAQLPGEEKGYQKSSGTFKKLAERINKQWEIETDLWPDQWHERLRIALSCDNIEVTNEDSNLTDEGIYRSDGYEIDPPLETFPTFPYRKAKTKVFKRQLIASVNSNCQTS